MSVGLHTPEVICTAHRADVSGVWYESFNSRIGRSHSMGAWLTFLCYKRILRTWLEHHICAPPRLIVDQAPFVALADVVNGHKDITGPQHECLAIGGSEFERSRQRNHVLRLRVRMPIIRGMRRRFLEMDGNDVGTIRFIDRAFKHMRCVIGTGVQLE